MALSKFEKFVIEEIDRSEIKNAEYNPRKLSDKAKKKLKDNLEKVGLIQPITWNRITGNIVSGHQRVALLDSLHKSKKYSLSVAVVEMDEKTEKEQNIFMNNTEAQGEFDLDSLGKLIKEVEIDNTGFDTGSVFAMFGENPHEMEEKEILSLSEKLQSAYEIQKEISEKLKTRDDTDFYTVFIFKDNKIRMQIHKELGFSDSQYQNGMDLKTT